jgi:hypothetical protein
MVVHLNAPTPVKGHLQILVRDDPVVAELHREACLSAARQDPDAAIDAANRFDIAYEKFPQAELYVEAKQVAGLLRSTIGGE